MNKYILNTLIKMANNLDARGFTKEADELDKILKMYSPDAKSDNFPTPNDMVEKKWKVLEEWGLGEYLKQLAKEAPELLDSPNTLAFLESRLGAPGDDWEAARTKKF